MPTAAGCTLANYEATCELTTWSPPLLDTQFPKSPSSVVIQNIDGVIPANAFSGLTNADNDTSLGLPELAFLCGFMIPVHVMTLLSDSLRPNLNWVQEIFIQDCYNMNIGDGAFTYMTGVTILTFLAGNFSSISSTAFTGMTSLETLNLFAAMPSTGVPSALFSGLTSLKAFQMTTSTMCSLPSGLFDDLTRLETLGLKGSGLTTLPADLFYPLLSLTSLNLDNNDWVCDCDLQWLGQYLTSTSLTTATCGSPDDLAGYDLQRAVLSLDCSTTTTTTTTTTTSATDTVRNLKLYMYALIGGVSLALLLATIACICLCRNNRKLRKLSQSRDGRNGENEENNRPISNASNWEPANGWYLPAETKQSGRSPQSSWEASNGRDIPTDTKSYGRPPPYASRHERVNISSSGRMFRSSSVSPNKGIVDDLDEKQ